MARARKVSLPLLLLLTVGLLLGVPPRAAAVPEADRLWVVGERSFQDGLYQLSVRTLSRLVERYPSDPRVPEATLLLGKARFSLKAYLGALEAFTKAASLGTPPGRPGEARFWEAETLFRLRRFDDARMAYERIAADPAASAFAADALYGAAWTNLETGRPEQAALQLRRLVDSYGDQAVAPAAAVYLGRTLVGLKRPREALPVLRDFKTKYPDHRLMPEARYFYARALLDSGDEQEGLAEMRAFVTAYPGHELTAQAQRAATGSAGRGTAKGDAGKGDAAKGDTGKSDAAKSDTVEEYKRLMAVTPASAESLYEAGLVATRLKRTKDAEAAWARLRKEFPNHALASRASLDLAQVAFTRSEYKESVALAQSATKSSTAAVRAEAFLLQGEGELKQRRFAPAHQAFQSALQVPDISSQVRYRALAGSGLAMEEQKQWDQAARYYDEVIAKSPDKTLKAWAKERRDAVATQLGAAKSGGAGQKAPPKRIKP